MCILIVDDEDMNLFVHAQLLKKNGYNVCTVSSAVDIVSSVQECSPELILIDYNMPEINGAEATRVLKSHPDCSQIPVVLFSSAINVDKLATDAGADGYFKKGDEHGILLQLIRSLIE